MTFFWDTPFESSVVFLLTMVPAVLPVVPGLLLALWARRRVAAAETSSAEMPTDGAGVAAAILRAGGAPDRAVVVATEPLADFYDPYRKEIRLSESVFSGRTPAALGVAAHEAGHALQDAQGYRPFLLRTPSVLAARLCCGVAWMSAFAGLVMLNPGLCTRGALLYSATVFVLLCLRVVERDANRRIWAVGPFTGLDAPPESSAEPFRAALDATTWSDIAATLPTLRGVWPRGRATTGPAATLCKSDVKADSSVE